MTELEDPVLQVEAWVTDTAVPTSYRQGLSDGTQKYFVIIGNEVDE